MALLVKKGYQIRSLEISRLFEPDARDDAWEPTHSAMTADVMEWLWMSVTEPILNVLTFTGKPPDYGCWSLTWWIAKGALAGHLPHVADFHSSRGANSMIDWVILSHDPPVRALLQREDGNRPADWFTRGTGTIVLLDIEMT